jgi:hypothetical protein
MSSTELLDAASNSKMFNDCPLLNETHDSQLLQASVVSLINWQFIVFANILAHVVFPTPLGPQNKKACAKWFCFIAFLSVLVICAWPTTVSNVAGRYFLAETTN